MTAPDGSIQCSLCGYTVPVEKCAHAKKVKVSQSYDLETAVDNRDGKTHRVEAMPDQDNTCWYCPDCGLWWDNNVGFDFELIKDDPHQWVDGKCWVCGAKQPVPVAAANGQPATQPTTPPPQVTEVPADEPVHGVAAADNLRMGVALAKAMESLVAESGNGALLEIEDVDQVLTRDECEQLRELSPADQVLVLMRILGYGAEGDNAASELDLAMSFSAQRLLAAVQARMDAMTAGDAAALADALAKYFPVANGRLEITLVTNVNGLQRERYTFEQVNGAWMFAGLTIVR